MSHGDPISVLLNLQNKRVIRGYVFDVKPEAFAWIGSDPSHDSRLGYTLREFEGISWTRGHVDAHGAAALQAASMLFRSRSE